MATGLIYDQDQLSLDQNLSSVLFLLGLFSLLCKVCFLYISEKSSEDQHFINLKLFNILWFKSLSVVAENHLSEFARYIQTVEQLVSILISEITRNVCSYAPKMLKISSCP